MLFTGLTSSAEYKTLCWAKGSIDELSATALDGVFGGHRHVAWDDLLNKIGDVYEMVPIIPGTFL